MREQPVETLTEDAARAELARLAQAAHRQGLHDAVGAGGEDRRFHLAWRDGVDAHAQRAEIMRHFAGQGGKRGLGRGIGGAGKGVDAAAGD